MTIRRVGRAFEFQLTKSRQIGTSRKERTRKFNCVLDVLPVCLAPGTNTKAGSIEACADPQGNAVRAFGERDDPNR